MQPDWNTILAQLSVETGQAIRLISYKPVHGGDISRAFQLITTAGAFFVKVNSSRLADMFRKEYSGLQAIQQTGSVAVPRPLCAGTTGNDQFLVLEWMETGRPADDFPQQFGHALATLHRQSHIQFGWVEDNYIGSLVQPNHYADNWPAFYASQRILPLMERAAREGRCEKKDVAMALAVCNKLSSIFPAEPASLLHGDLWSGNYITGSNGYACVFDPAVYYGHREMDLAMMLLFGGFDPLLYQYYNQAYPLEKNWLRRTDLCQLYPLLVHLILFGGGYYARVKAILEKYN